MERVKKGERYWHLYLGSRNITTMEKTDYYNSTDDDYFKSGDYFTTKEEAESMARKLRAVLKGADVIEMPSEEEIETYKKTLNHPHTPGCDYMERVVTDRANYSYLHGFQLGINWLKSKIVK